MISPDEAIRLILENSPTLSEELAPLGQSIGRSLSQDIYSQQELPPFDNSAMDGFAVRVQDCLKASQQTPVLLTVRETTVRAGARAQMELHAGEAIKIMTGASLPEGADAVIMKEETLEESNGYIRILKNPRKGENIRCRGEDVRTGDLILKKMSLIRPFEVGLLAAQGFIEVPVIKRAIVSVLSTGDELVEIGEPLMPGAIRNSNGPALCVALSKWNVLTLYKGIVKDDPALMKKAFLESLEHSDLLLVSGGVSVGDYDYTKVLLEELGLRVIFWKVAIKPGKPLLFGAHQNKLVFGLPGNPVSALVCMEEFVRAALEKMMGVPLRDTRCYMDGTLQNDYHKDESKQHYLFCQVSEEQKEFKVRVILPQGSAMIGTACKANALAIAPLGTKLLIKGSKIAFRWLT